LIVAGVKQNFETRWIGWAGVNVPDEEGRASLTEALALKGCVPVFLDEDTVDQYYNGYCNNVLWPLFHYIGLPQEDRLAATRSMDSQFNAYKHANQLFAKVVFSQYQVTVGSCIEECWSVCMNALNYNSLCWPGPWQGDY
jgi:trehalose 6-phosphate synthase/phosphatase